MIMVSTQASTSSQQHQQQGGNMSVSPIPEIPFSNSNSSSEDLQGTTTSTSSSSSSLSPTRQSRSSMNTAVILPCRPSTDSMHPPRQSSSGLQSTSSSGSFSNGGPISLPGRPTTTTTTSNLKPRRQTSSGLSKLHLSQDNIISLNHPKVSVHPSWATTKTTADGSNSGEPNNALKLSPLLESPSRLSSKLSSLSDYTNTTANISSIASPILTTATTTISSLSSTDKDITTNNEEFIIAQRELIEAALKLTKIVADPSNSRSPDNKNSNNILYQKIWESSFDSIVVTNNKGLIQYVNPTFQNEFGYTNQSDIIDKDVSILSGIMDQEENDDEDGVDEAKEEAEDDKSQTSLKQQHEDTTSIDSRKRRSTLLSLSTADGEEQDVEEAEILYSKRKDGTKFLSIFGARQVLLSTSVLDSSPSDAIESSGDGDGDGDDDDDQASTSNDEYTVFFIRNVSCYVNDHKLMTENCNKEEVIKEEVDGQTTKTEQEETIWKLQNQVTEMKNQIEKQREELFEKTVECESWENSAMEYEIQSASREGLISALVESLGVDDETKLTDELATLFKNYDSKVKQCKLFETSLEIQTQKTNNLEIKVKELEKQLQQQGRRGGGGETTQTTTTTVFKSEGENQEEEGEARASIIVSTDADASAPPPIALKEEAQQQSLHENEMLQEKNHQMSEYIERLQGEMRDTMKVASDLQSQLKNDNEKLFEDNREMQNYIRDLEEETSAIEIQLEEVTKLNEGYRMELKARRKEDKKAAKRKDNDTTFMEDLVDAAIMTDLDGNILRVNDVTLNMFGYESKNNLVGKDLSILLGEKNHNKLVENFNKAPGAAASICSSSTHTDDDSSSVSSSKPKVMKNRLFFGHRKNGKEILCSASFKSGGYGGGYDNNCNIMIGFLRDMSGLKGKTIPYEGGKYKASENGIPLSMYTTNVEP